MFKIWNVPDEVIEEFNKEALRRYGGFYKSRKAMLIEMVEEYVDVSRQKPSFADLKKIEAPFPNVPQNKKMGVIERKYWKIVSHLITKEIDPRQHPGVLMGLIMSTWKAKHTWEQKKKEILKMYDEQMYELSKMEVEE